MTYLDSLLLSIPFPYSLITVCTLMVCICLLAVKAHALTWDGAAAAFAVGVGVLWCLMLEGFLILMFFFLSAGVLGRISRKYKNKNLEKKEGARDAVQVFANGFLATLGALGYYFFRTPVFLVIFIASMAEANSDTWAGEIGRLSRRKPVSIRTFKPVEKGISGGITALGIIGGFLGSASVCIIAALLFPIDSIWLLCSMACLAAFAGCILDSLLGAYAQVLYFDPSTGNVTERDTDAQGNPLEISQGIRWVDNDMVNFMSNTFSAVLAMGLVCWI